MIVSKLATVPFTFRKIKYNLLFTLIVGTCISYITNKYNHIIPEIPVTISAFLGTAISILLSFKMNQSYDRWWEARKIWGSIVNDSRSLVIQLQSFFKQEQSSGMIKRLTYRQIAWCYSLSQTLRGLDPFLYTQDLLSQEDMDYLLTQQNIPLGILNLNAREINDFIDKNSIDPISKVHLNSILIQLINSMGKAERINSTVFPMTYRLVLHFTIYLFVIILSISLQNIPMYMEVPILVLISIVFFMLDKTADNLQDPFRNRPSDTPMLSICNTIEINLRQLISEDDVSVDSQPETFYLL
ncbi:MAG: hypothetical protein KDK54_12380 [Leptospiraceae bacterium]|nr:hypothetical protein [Leptospiraceae bacterium]